MRILLSGSTGFVGSALAPWLRAQGHEVIPLVRHRARHDVSVASWDATTGAIKLETCGPIDAVLHLAGENIAGRWTRAKKQRILHSRVAGTRLLSQTIAGLERRPVVMISASAVGYYGDRGDEVLTETSSAGVGFLAEVCREWEAATGPAAAAGIRVVNLRMGVVLGAKGGALAKMLLPFRFGLGGRAGSGRQYMSWIAIDDLLAAIHHVLTAPLISGPVNAVSPQPITNREFTRILGTVLSRPAILPVPPAGLRLVFGEAADQMILASCRAVPQRLEQTGFVFRFGDLEGALRQILA